MPDRTLKDCRVLVVEDEYMLADDLSTELVFAGAIVLGPVGTLPNAMASLDTRELVDGAILDVNLGGEMVYPFADRLLERDVPFVFTTGYDEAATPPRFAHVVRCEKPISMKRVTQAIGRVIHS